MSAVRENVVSKGWCVGCGICAGVCPTQNLFMKFNERGEYEPHIVEPSRCKRDCGLCISVCPMLGGKDRNSTDIGTALYSTQNGVRHLSETGYFLHAYAGYSQRGDHRLQGASGGLATWFLEQLLESGVVNAVACVGSVQDKANEKRFEFRLCQSANEIRACSRSCYYPVEVSDILQQIQKSPGRYAMIGLPCVCRGIRLAQKSLPRLRQRIVAIAGLVCGHQVGRYFCEYVCALAGGNPKQMTEVVFRKKEAGRSNFGASFLSGWGEREADGHLYGKPYAPPWGGSFFQIPGCFYCDDALAECADIVFMDAWLPQFVGDWRGNSLVMTRDKLTSDMLRNGIENGDLELTSVDVRSVVSSQANSLRKKRVEISVVLDQCRRAGKFVPDTRELLHVAVDPLRRFTLYHTTRLKFRRALRSASAWVETSGNLKQFHSKVRGETLAIALIEMLARFKRFVSQVTRLKMRKSV